MTFTSVTFIKEPAVLAVDAALDAALEDVPQTAAVFVIWPQDGGDPYIARTGELRRRLKRLLKQPAQPSRLLNLRSVADRVEYWPVASHLQSTLVLWEVARQYSPANYLDIVKLRFPAYVKLMLGNAYPRTQITTRITGLSGRYYGPFRSRGSAEEFEHQLLDLFQLRRCQEDLVPAPDHPGCIYGEMGMCLRPCQQAVGPEEYAAEVHRVSEFLASAGRRLLRESESARDRLSAELDFEAAAREHKRVERIRHVLQMRDELANDIEELHGVAVTPSPEPHVVLLWFLIAGGWRRPVHFSLALADQSVSMDRRLKEITATLEPDNVGLKERQEHLAILARWYYSSWRDGEWIPIPALANMPFRRIIGAISRTAGSKRSL
jgi:excinuclease ABC subunit C